MKLNFSISIVLFSTMISAQNNMGSWNVTNINAKINDKWSVFAEAQLRSLSFYNQFHYYEYKGGVSFKITKNFSATTGVGSYNTYSENGNFEMPIQNQEVRTWIQINMKNPVEFVTFEHRYRAEQRFTSNGYKNRFRYRIAVTVPLNNKKIEPKTLYLLAWNELFFTDKEPYFERNRLFIGSGYEFSENFAFQLGYIYQFDYKINDETGRDFLNLSLLYNFKLRKKTKNEFVPSTAD